jgi:hypothetical protein
MIPLAFRLRMLLRDRSQRIWSDEDLEAILELVCDELYIDRERLKNHSKILWTATEFAIEGMLEQPPTHLSAMHLSTYRILMGNACNEAERAVQV